MVTSAKQWKSKSKTGEHIVHLPSGNEAKCRAIRPEAFLESGMIPEPLTALITKAINNKRGLPPTELKKIAADPKQLASALEMFDRALVYCVIEPHVEMPPVCVHGASDDSPGCGELYTSGNGVHIDRSHPDFHRYVEPERDENILYADEVDLEDKQFIFQWAVGGHNDVERFRKEHKAAMGSVQKG